MVYPNVPLWTFFTPSILHPRAELFTQTNFPHFQLLLQLSKTLKLPLTPPIKLPANSPVLVALVAQMVPLSKLGFNATKVLVPGFVQHAVDQRSLKSYCFLGQVARFAVEGSALITLGGTEVSFVLAGHASHFLSTPF